MKGWFSFLLLILLLAGCGPVPVRPSAVPSPVQNTSTVTVMPSPTPATSVTPSPTAVPPTGLCSPLQGEQLTDLSKPDLLKNTFQAPRPGRDDGHHGIDLAYWTGPDGKAMLGLPVHSVLDGQVAAVLPNHIPYGNAVIIETPLKRLPSTWLDKLREVIAGYHPPASLNPAVGLVCPEYNFQPPSGEKSLYLLYAHLQQPAQLKVGQTLTCADSIGLVGTSGNSVNPHLHLETRIGPSGMTFASMDHYNTAATEDDRRAYCLWRVSGAFQPFDPLLLLSIQ